MGLVDEIQTDLKKEGYFHPEIQRLGWKYFSQKCYCILVTEKLADSFTEVA